jgi:hypothetical protein
MDKQGLRDFLNERFQKFGNTWMVHEWTYYGMSYGLEIKENSGEFRLEQMVDSGYNHGKVVETDWKKIYNIVEQLMPTKRGFKFDRKD